MWSSGSPRRFAALPLVALCTLGVPAGAGAGADVRAISRPAAYDPSVEAMVVGRGGGVLAGARWVSASAGAVRVAGRDCAVAAGTPLAVLAGLRRAGGPGFAIRDYGHCGSSPASSAELFVYSIGGEANRAQSGWEYKVEGIAGSTGAADPSGPEGNGRPISQGQRVLWFWCEASAGGCERTLAVAPARAAAVRGGRLTVTVTSYDNEGRPAPVAGAIVALGSRASRTDRHGHTTLVLPAAAGGYWLTATRPGLVPAFPGWVEVR